MIRPATLIDNATALLHNRTDDQYIPICVILINTKTTAPVLLYPDIDREKLIAFLTTAVESISSASERAVGQVH